MLWLVAFGVGPLLMGCGSTQTQSQPAPASALHVAAPPDDAPTNAQTAPVAVTEDATNLDLSTPEALAAAMLAALRSGDAGAADRLLLTLDEAALLCPNARNDAARWKELTNTFAGQLRERWADKFHQCRVIFDFSAARIVEVKAKPVEQQGPREECGPAVDVIDDIEVVVQSSHSRYTFRIDDAVRAPSGWKTTDLLTCPTGPT